MLEITLIILNTLLISILVGLIVIVYKFYKSYGKSLMNNLQNFSKISEQFKNQQNPLEQFNNLMNMFKKK